MAVIFELELGEKATFQTTAGALGMADSDARALRAQPKVSIDFFWRQMRAASDRLLNSPPQGTA